MVWLPDGEKILKIWLLVLTQYTNVTDKRTDGYRLNSIASRSKNRAAFIFIITLASVGQFLPRDAYASRGLCRRNYVRLSVTLTRRYCVQTVKHILKDFSLSGSPTILVFPHQTEWQYSDVGRWMHMKKPNFRPISCFISQMMQASYYERRIGNRTQSFEWDRFEWPWVTSNPDFKVMISFNVK